MIRFSFILLLSATLFSTACSSSGTPENLGPISATGSLTPASVSLIRRGTHLFIVNKTERYFLESKEVNLSEFEGEIVFIEGERVLNSKKNELPVIIVKTIRQINDTTHAWEIPILGIRLDLPVAWKGALDGQKASFTASGSTVLTAEIDNENRILHGKEIFLESRKGVIDTSMKEQARVALDNGKNRVILTFIIETLCGGVVDCSASMVEAGWIQSFVEKNISFIGKEGKIEQSPLTGTPCGGEAGILCATGSFCDIQDRQHQVGICRARK